MLTCQIKEEIEVVSSPTDVLLVLLPHHYFIDQNNIQVLKIAL